VLAHRLCVNLARRVHELTVASRNLLHNDAPARFAQWLLQRCPATSGACELRLQERKRDIAQQLAMTPETLSRLMRSFESRGVIDVRGYHLHIHDVQALRSLVGIEGASTR
jgi:CRP-like cAMP-binding protein